MRTVEFTEEEYELVEGALVGALHHYKSLAAGHLSTISDEEPPERQHARVMVARLEPLIDKLKA